MLRELAVERLRFSCPGCAESWTVDYDVQHVEDAEGDIFEYYSLNGIPVEVPTTRGTVTCPRCGRWALVELLARRPIPVLTPESAPVPGRRVDPERLAAKHGAPLLAGTAETPA